jgi:glutathione synthase/RimK-type ligase-like ATP-grasp enzyme
VFKIINKPGSQSCKFIREEAGIGIYKGKTNPMPNFLVNYGVSGNKLNEFYKKFPSAKNIPTINRNVGISKLRVVNIAKENGILVPESKLRLTKDDLVKDFIEKRINSIGGIGIKKATKKDRIEGKYYQRYIKNRLFELRVHAFEWTKPSVQKRYGDKDQIAWNFNKGGHFQTVFDPEHYKIFKDAIDISNKVLNILNMGFGAVDFLVDEDHKLYFIEINSAPGFSTLSQDIYKNAFMELKKLNKTQINKLKCL